MELDRLWVYYLKVVAQKSSRQRAARAAIEGGQLELSEEIRSIFEPAFLGEEKRSPKRQPFHFNFGGNIRSNSTRDHLLSIMEKDNPESDKHCQQLARELQDIIDDRIGDMLFTVAVGWESELKKCAMWVYPNENSIRFFSNRGKPMVEELRQAFSRRSKYRKAIFFEGPNVVTRNDFLRGQLVDLTRQGRSRSVAHYWVERFLHGQIELKPARGIFYLAKGLKLAQKCAKTVEEKASVIAAYNILFSGTVASTSLTQFSNTLRGAAKDAYLSTIPTTIEKDAIFELDQREIRRRVSRIVYVLENGIEVIFPADDSVDVVDYIVVQDGKEFLRIELPVESRHYS